MLLLSNVKPEQIMAVKGIIEHDVFVVPYGKSASLPLVLYESGTPGIVGGFSALSQPIHHTPDVAHSVWNPSAYLLLLQCVFTRD